MARNPAIAATVPVRTVRRLTPAWPFVPGFIAGISFRVVSCSRERVRAGLVPADGHPCPWLERLAIEEMIGCAGDPHGAVVGAQVGVHGAALVLHGDHDGGDAPTPRSPPAPPAQPHPIPAHPEAHAPGGGRPAAP